MDNAWTSNGDLPPKQKDKAIYLRIPVEPDAAVEVKQVSGLLSGHRATKETDIQLSHVYPIDNCVETSRSLKPDSSK